MRVLVVDDNEDTCTLLCMGLERTGHYAASARSLTEARAALASATATEPFDAILTDWNLGDGTASDLIELAGKRRVVILTGDERALSATWGSTVRVLKKPAPFSDVVAALR